MCELTKKLDEIAQELITKSHSQILKTMTDEDKERFVNASATINIHSQVIQKTQGLTL